jgi:hypothetical protein
MKKILGIILVIIVALGVWYMLLGGREYIETSILGQDAVAVDITFTHHPITASPEMRNMTIDIEVKCYKTRVSKAIDIEAGPTEKKYHIQLISTEDKAAAHGAQVEFDKTITIYNGTGHLVFKRTMTMNKATDKVIKIYSSVEELKPGTTAKIEIKIEMEITLPTPQGMTPSTIQWTLEKSFTKTIEG